MKTKFCLSKWNRHRRTAEHNENTQIIIIWKCSLDASSSSREQQRKSGRNAFKFFSSFSSTSPSPRNKRKEKTGERRWEKEAKMESGKGKMRSSDGRFFTTSSRIKMLQFRAALSCLLRGYRSHEYSMLTVFTHKSTHKVARILMEFLFKKNFFCWLGIRFLQTYFSLFFWDFAHVSLAVNCFLINFGTYIKEMFSRWCSWNRFECYLRRKVLKAMRISLVFFDWSELFWKIRLSPVDLCKNFVLFSGTQNLLAKTLL